MAGMTPMSVGPTLMKIKWILIKLSEVSIVPDMPWLIRLLSFPAFNAVLCISASASLPDSRPLQPAHVLFAHSCYLCSIASDYLTL